MVLEMKRALEELKAGNRQGYRDMFDATFPEVLSRSFLILQQEDQAAEFMKDFYSGFFRILDEADGTADPEKWFWTKYYQELRRQYHKFLKAQTKTSRAGTLAGMLAGLPLLHRIMLVMTYMDDMAASEISGIFGLEEAKISGELEKLEKYLPALSKGQPEKVASYLANWRVLLMGASRQVLSGKLAEQADAVFQHGAQEAGIVLEPETKEDNFDYFIADVELPEMEPEKEEPKPVRKKAAPIPVVEDEYDEAEDEDEYEDDEYDEDEYDEDEDEDDRYDWDLEDDGKKMVILGAVLALIIVVLVGFGAYKLLNRDKDDQQEQTMTEQEEDGEASLIIKGDGPDEEGEAEPEAPVEEPEEPAEPEPEPEPEEPAEPETYFMEVTGSSVNVRSEANTSSDIVTKVKAGETVEVLSDPAQEWVQIRCTEQNDEEGYMKTEYLTDVE